ncbi:MAG: hypothetical protein AAF702_46890 [Chloroflexota bacterium]
MSLIILSGSTTIPIIQGSGVDDGSGVVIGVEVGVARMDEKDVAVGRVVKGISVDVGDGVNDGVNDSGGSISGLAPGLVEIGWSM